MKFHAQSKFRFLLAALVLQAPLWGTLSSAETALCSAPPGGSVTCEPGQLAKCAVSSIGVVSWCKTPPKNLSGAALKVWVIEKITGKRVSNIEAERAEYNNLFVSGQWQSADAQVTFSLPSSLTVSTSSVSSGLLSTADAKFVRNAAIVGKKEVEIGRLAAQKASDPDIKSFGQRMVDDHSKANGQLEQIAVQKGITLPASEAPGIEKEVEKLSRLSGEAFDRAYMSMMVRDKKWLIADFRKISRGGKDADIKSFAAATLPTLQDHLKMAQGISSSLHKHQGNLEQ